jgi:very-short-patch-repair endonuclease
MPYKLPSLLRDLADLQRGVISRGQALSAGLSSGLIESRLTRGRWQRLHTGVYAVFTGHPHRDAVLWAAVLRAGQGAALSYQTAAELDGLLDKPASLIHVTVPASRRVTPARGIVVHARLGAEDAVHPVRLPPRTRLEETVLDLCDGCGDLDNAIGWLTSALGRRLTNQERLFEAMARRGRIRWRSDLDLMLRPEMTGVHSVLEYRYVRDVERAHRLPTGKRQARVTRERQREYRDVLYDEFALTVELDGNLAHQSDRRWLDIRRDNAAAAGGLITLRYGYRDVRVTPCLVAAQIGQVLRLRGWTGMPHPCSPGCPASVRP